ncbi:MAG TPA: trypsin-like peptidase domain-containing protein [Gemmataceae bacterium]
MKSWSVVLASLLAGALIGGLALLPFTLNGQGQSPVSSPVPKEMTSYRDVVKKVLPAVVSIESRAKPAAKAKQPKKRTPPDDEQTPEELRRYIEELRRQQAQEPDDTPELGFGSGFLVDPKGVILTNFHVVDGADQVIVELKDGRKFTSKDMHGDPKTDLAIIRIQDAKPLPYLEMGDSNAMEIGDRVLAVGAPFRLAGTVTAGIVSAKGRNLKLNMYEDFLQTDAAINPGNSGGPLVNLEGKVIGISSAIKSRTGGFQGIGMAISSNLAQNIMQQLLKDGMVHRGYLGIQMKDLIDREVAARLGVGDQGGVLVTQVFDKAPASKAGMQEGDVITELAGKPIHDGHELQNVVANEALGKPVALSVMRDGKPKSLSVTIEEQPADYGKIRLTVPRVPRDAPAVPLDNIGVEATDLTPELAEKLGYKDGAGALITKVDADGLAADAGLGRGMVVLRADKQPIKTATELKDYLSKAALEKGVLLQTTSPQGAGYVLLKKEARSKP